MLLDSSPDDGYGTLRELRREQHSVRVGVDENLHFVSDKNVSSSQELSPRGTLRSHEPERLRPRLRLLQRLPRRKFPTLPYREKKSGHGLEKIYKQLHKHQQYDLKSVNPTSETSLPQLQNP